MIHSVSRLAIALLVLAPMQLRAAETAGECRLGCDHLAEADHRVCSDLPANASCATAVEMNHRRCHEFCGRNYPEQADQPPQTDGVAPDRCDAERRACP
jgi:hypothetical protein